MGQPFSKSATPAKIPTDTVLPLSYLDDQKVYRKMRLQVSLCFNDVLDAEKLRGAFARLLEMEGWRKLGARLRLNSEGKLEYHLPATFNKDRPPFLYSFEHFGSSIADHPVGSRLPRGCDQPMIFEGASKLSSLLGDPRIPRDYKEWIKLDIPQLGLRIVTFNDATCVTLTFLHSLTDAMGLAAILRAWVAILHGKENEVPPFFGFDTNPMSAVLEKPSPRFVLADRILRGFPLLMLGVRAYLESLWYRNEGGVLFLPAEKVEQMCQNALSELAAQNPDADKKPFVSENDVLSAWFARALMRIEQPAANRTVIVTNAFDCRDVLAQMGIIPSPDVGLVTNCVNTCWTVVTGSQVLEEPLGLLALRVRKSLEQQRTAEQVRASLAEVKNAIDRTSYPMIIGDFHMKVLNISNWQKASFYTLDFSPAVTKVGTLLNKRDNQLGKASYICVATMGVPFSNMGAVVGKDARGNWWFTFSMCKKLWSGIEQQLKET